MSERRTFADAFSQGLERQGMSLVTLRDALAARGLPLSLATLSYWRAGQRQPRQEQSLRAVMAIEEILGLLPGELESLTAPGARRMPKSDPLSVYDEWRDIITSLLSELGLRTPFDEVIEREVTAKYDVDEQGRTVCYTHISVMEAVVGGARRFALAMVGETPGEPLPRFTALGGFRVGRVIADEEAMVTVAEMLLDEELAAGETAIVEQQVEIEGDEHDTDLRYWAWPRMKSISLWVRFHRDKLPARCESFTVVDGVETVEDTLIQGTGVHRTVADFGPGVLGIRWFWEDD